ncbi:hypothetical protein GUITHDRAFT_111875 [Guillardia theta CCMP2712]|uniref:Uncharacterized protein n=1 Tax=Guillardia theta (strain CCMP2712) TaxID=905079 RepID=L1J1Q6_GUITC|nr:hypothetical protein GUITHDRAFT_111875 [Guillardia theta CCMP2712]EKX42020.1 hypothetical protein GUITHDRAFT_111875 [Guillardia theta CCMP2712]|eukprot:XP_005829000.1 hypothetical protein GUITHDRAFT_111875 [Guillardia theta CCMP2712]
MANFSGKVVVNAIILLSFLLLVDLLFILASMALAASQWSSLALPDMVVWSSYSGIGMVGGIILLIAVLVFIERRRY